MARRGEVYAQLPVPRRGSGSGGDHAAVVVQSDAATAALGSVLMAPISDAKKHRTGPGLRPLVRKRYSFLDKDSVVLAKWLFVVEKASLKDHKRVGQLDEDDVTAIEILIRDLTGPE